MTVRRITSLQHPLVKHFVKLKSSSRYRSQHQSVLIEGKDLVREVTASLPAKAAMAAGKESEGSCYHAEVLYLVSDAVIKKVSGTLTPEGVVAEVSMPEAASLQGASRVLALDRVRDPGNMGALLRTALALGWDGAFLLDGCCDPYNDKALRAAKGATFRLPWRKGSWEALKGLSEENGLSLLAADMEGGDIHAEEKDGLILVLGNEAQGLSDEARCFCKRVSIPMAGEMESLNVSVAGGILMYVLSGKFDER